MNDLGAAEKRLSIVLNATGQEKDLRDSTSTNARNALGRESAFAQPAAAQASFKLRHNQADRLPVVVVTAGKMRATARAIT
jgi:hypothetical protein